jgi:hypothetical protein
MNVYYRLRSFRADVEDRGKTAVGKPMRLLI